AWLAADRGEVAARHAQLAARLEPDNAALAATAEQAVDLALAYRLRPLTRPAGVFSAFLLGLMLLGALGKRRERRRTRAYLDSLGVRVGVWADGEQLGSPFSVAPRTENLTVDLFFRGRHGMACPRRPAQMPTVHIAFSSPGSNRTMRLRPVRDVTESAIRVPVSPETLQRLLAQPGAWRLHVRVGERPVLAVPFEVRGLAAAAHPRHAHALN
ncbi:MAG: hypothetical protein O2894_13120, partial [Planctomycetota bacterium]|nr:hypothetical protein [Planctomycetota bacterium]